MLALADALRRRSRTAPTCGSPAWAPPGAWRPGSCRPAGYDLRLIPPVPLPRKPTLDLLRVPGRVWRAVGRHPGAARRAAAPTWSSGSAATWRCPPTSPPGGSRCRSWCTSRTRCPGLANRIGARLAARVAVTVPGTPLPNAEHVGMPLRTAISSLDRAAPPRRGAGGVRPGPRPAHAAGVRRLAGRGAAQPRRRRRRRRARRGRACRCCTPAGRRTPTYGSGAPGG